ncbi:MAG: hypothetical protein ACD_84C00039G0009 [uncultured bacterium]|nr:MAG: hypothetical protein ACD_84C00039G0009 [uncultured bacterium]
MLFKTQDAKYSIEILLNDHVKDGAMNARLVNAVTGEPIPEDEPVFLIRAKDLNAVSALEHYARECKKPNQASAIRKRLTEFYLFIRTFPERMKEPDTASNNCEGWELIGLPSEEVSDKNKST